MIKVLLVNDSLGTSRAFDGLKNVKLDDVSFKPYGPIFPSKETIGNYDVLVFTGGCDINPCFYGHTSPKNFCCFSHLRDDSEFAVYNTAKELGIKMVGICRGHQLLAALNGAKLYHHVNGHCSSRHLVTDGKETFFTNSLHHQMVQHDELTKDWCIGWTQEKQSEIFIGDEDKEMPSPEKEIEILHCKNRFFSVQYHPEFMQRDEKGKKHFQSLFIKYCNGEL